jgi:hypothetical protein
MPYTIGIFQYSLLYAWPQPGINAERLVAIRGLCLGTVSFLVMVQQRLNLLKEWYLFALKRKGCLLTSFSYHPAHRYYSNILRK